MKMDAVHLGLRRRMNNSEKEIKMIIGSWEIYFCKIITPFMIISIRKWDLLNLEIFMKKEKEILLVKCEFCTI